MPMMYWSGLPRRERCLQLLSTEAKEQRMGIELGAFSISLSVANIEASLSFYEKLGFTQSGGDSAEKWAIMRNGEHVIGLFSGMFDRNMLTFNPGWDQNARETETFTDIREIRKELTAKGLVVEGEFDEATRGPASFIVVDPDGNPILVDQHV
jgi:catechol 2,3-dioxygenase-like lactoylglutathione lyase family enzyme